MHRRRHFQHLIVTLALTVLACQDLTQPTDRMSPPPTGQTVNQLGAFDLKCVPLLTARDLAVGSVCIANEEHELLVRVRMDGRWRLSEMRLAAAATPEGLPRTRSGNPIIGHFPFRQRYESAPQVFTETVPLSLFDVETGTKTYVSIRAKVHDGIGREDVTVWADGVPFSARRKPEGTYFEADLVSGEGLTAEFLGPAGGTISGQSGTPLAGLTLSIPEGALAREELVTIGPGDPASYQGALDAARLGTLAGPVADIQTTSPSLGKPVSLTLPFNEAAFPSGPADIGIVTLGASGETEAQLGAFPGVNANGEAVSVTGEWLEAAWYEVDAPSNTVTVEVNHFSQVAVVVIPVDQYNGSTSPEGYNDLTQQPPPGARGARGSDPTGIVIHSTDSPTGEISQGAMLWTPYNSPYAAHYYIHRNGQVSQLIPDANMAAHSGDAFYNQSAIGIELHQHVTCQGTVCAPADAESYTEAQRNSLEQLLIRLSDDYGITRENIIGHSEVPGAAERGKADPREFDWTLVDEAIDDDPPPPPPPPEDDLMTGTWTGGRTLRMYRAVMEGGRAVRGELLAEEDEEELTCTLAGADPSIWSGGCIATIGEHGHEEFVTLRTSGNDIEMITGLGTFAPHCAADNTATPTSIEWTCFWVTFGSTTLRWGEWELSLTKEQDP